MTDEVESLYAQIAALTAPACAECAVPFACCTPHGCSLAAAHTLRTDGAEAPAGDHPTLRYMGPNGCLLAPHRRPACATYSCVIRDPARRRANPEFAKTYRYLRALIASRAA